MLKFSKHGTIPFFRILTRPMTGEFILEIIYRQQEYRFPADLIQRGYTHQFRVALPDTDVFFEPDEEGSYRAIRMPGQEEKAFSKIERGLLEAVGQKIEESIR
jgi:hypothetical protein